MKILRAEKFQPKKRSKKERLSSATPEAKEEDIRIDEEPENQPANEYEEQNVSSDLEPRAKDESQLKVDPEPGESSEKSLQNDAKIKNLTDHGMQTFFENLEDDYPEPLSQDMNLSNNLSGHTPKDNLEHMSHEEQQTNFTPEPEREQKREQNQKSVGTGEAPLKVTAAISKLRRSDLKTLAQPEEGDEERPKRKKKYSGDRGGEFTEPPKISTRDVLNIVFKRKLQIFVFFLTVLAMVIIGSFLLEPIYKASTQILVKLGRESMYVPTGPINAPFLNIDRAAQVNSEIEILKSQSLEQKVIATIGLAVIYENFKDKPPGVVARIRASFFPDVRQKMSPDERKAFNFDAAGAKFKKALEVTGIKKSNVIQVDFKHKDPQIAAMVVNKLAELYRDHHLLVHKRPQNVKFFEKQSHRLKIKLNQTEARLKALREKYNITSLEEQRSLLLGQIAELNSKVNETKSLAAETESRIHELRRQLSNIPNTISQGEVSDKNPFLINTLEARLVELQLKEKELLAKYTDQNRLVQNVKEEIKVVNKKLSEQETRSFGKKTSVANPVHQQVQEDLFRNESEVEALKAKGISQAENLTNLQREIEQLNSVDFEVNQLKQRIEMDQENYRLYLTKVEESRISDAMDAEKITSVSLISPARPPRDPVFPIMILNILIGIFLGTFGGLMLAFIREYLDDRIERIEDVEKELMLPVLASIPIFEQKAVGV